MRTSGLHHLALRTSDLAASERFYVDLLGLPVLERFYFEDGRPRSVWVGVGDAFLALEVGPAGPAPADADPGWHCVALRIARSERAAWRARLERAGVPIERESAYTLYVRDPSGALVGLSHYPDAADRARLNGPGAPRRSRGSPHRS
ncbi:MAG TPA: VOC family protein [Sandaracinaceae bacterium]